MIKLTKRGNLTKSRERMIEILAVLGALVFAGLVIGIMGFNPVLVYLNIVDGSLGSLLKFQQTIIKAIPLIIASMGILIAFKMKFWNIGGEGQIMMGAFGATFVALNLPPTLSSWIVLPLMALAGMICGGLWAFIPAFFKAKFGTNETIFTLMLNYIAIKFVMYLQNGPWRAEDSQGFPKIELFSPNEVLPKVLNVHIGWIIAIIVVVLVYIFLNHTKKGYEITVVGESLATAKYAGMNIKSIILTAMIASGGLCGLAGMVQASAVAKSLTYGLSANIGFTAIITAWLGRLSAPLVAGVCILFAMLLQGGNAIQVAMSVPASVADLIQGIILFFVLGSEFFLQYKVSFRFGKKTGEVK